MKVFQKVRSTATNIPSVEVNIDTVYIRSNIIRVEEINFSGWEYDEIQYTLREYQEIIGKKTTVNEECVIDVDFRLSVIELGL